MGDRGNIVVKMDPAPVYLYSHWRGSDLKEVLRRALAKRWRWTDESYLCRIIGCELWKGHEATETGFGISTYAPDNEHALLVVDCGAQTVSECAHDTKKANGVGKPSGGSWTFEEFLVATFDSDEG